MVICLAKSRTLQASAPSYPIWVFMVHHPSDWGFSRSEKKAAALAVLASFQAFSVAGFKGAAGCFAGAGGAGLGATGPLAGVLGPAGGGGAFGLPADAGTTIFPSLGGSMKWLVPSVKTSAMG